MRRLALLLAVAALVVPGCGVTRRTAAPWNLRAPAVGDVLRIRIGIGSATCDRLHGVKLFEDDDEVRVTATVERNGTKGCSGDYATVDQEVHLGQPLGARRLSGCRPAGPLTVGERFGGRESDSTCFETSSLGVP